MSKIFRKPGGLFYGRVILVRAPLSDSKNAVHRKAFGKRGGVLIKLSNFLQRKNGIEIKFSSNIGEGLCLSHPYGITVNPGAVLGRDVTIFKGATVGSVRSGKRKGTPTIGDNVVIGVNAFICGGIRIGNDVLIAANSFVDFDVPDHSLVLGNPAVIKHKENASSDYQL